MKKLHRTIPSQILFCLVMVTPSRAADPITGTWKLDARASKFVVDEAPK